MLEEAAPGPGRAAEAEGGGFGVDGAGGVAIEPAIPADGGRAAGLVVVQARQEVLEFGEGGGPGHRRHLG